MNEKRSSVKKLERDKFLEMSQNTPIKSRYISSLNAPGNWDKRIEPVKCKCGGNLIGIFNKYEKLVYGENYGTTFYLDFVACEICKNVFHVSVLPEECLPSDIYPYYGIKEISHEDS